MTSGLLRSIAIVALLSAATAVGWVSRGWHVDSLELIAHKAADAATAAQLELQAEHAKRFEQFLLKESKRVSVIEKEVQRVVERPVYSNVCLDVDGLRLANAAKNGTDPGEPKAALPAP